MTDLVGLFSILWGLLKSNLIMLNPKAVGFKSLLSICLFILPLWPKSLRHSQTWIQELTNLRESMQSYLMYNLISSIYALN